MTSAVTTPIGVLALGGGAVMLWSAFTGQNPLTELRAALSTGKLPEGGGPTPIAAARVINDQGGTDDGGSYGPFQSGSTGRPPVLVPIGQGSHKLSPLAMIGFRRAEQAFRGIIPVTDSARDYAAQAAAHQRDPERFGRPDDNAHVMGVAVDVNLGAVGANPQGSTPARWLDDAAYRRLFDAFTVAGWCNWQMNRGDLGGKIPEPWHFSFGRCG